jgi:hypothetical protein
LDQEAFMLDKTPLNLAREIEFGDQNWRETLSDRYVAFQRDAAKGFRENARQLEALGAKPEDCRRSITAAEQFELLADAIEAGMPILYPVIAEMQIRLKAMSY